MSDGVAEEAELNQVVLRGRVTGDPEARELPSGTAIVTVRITVGRTRTHMTNGSKQTSDWVECVAWSPRCRRSVGSWRVGDTVEVEGALRRRFFRTSGGGSVSKIEIEVLKGRVVARAG